MEKKCLTFLCAVGGLSLAVGLTASAGSASAAVSCVILSDGNGGGYACSGGDGDELKAFADKKSASTNSFFMSVGKNIDTEQDVGVTTIGAVSVDSGFGEIKPAKGNTLTDLVFTPTAKAAGQYDGMIFRGQFEDIKKGTSFDGNLFGDVTSKGGGVTQFEWSGLPTNADHVLLGFDEPKGSAGLPVLSVELFVQNGEFKSIKQIEFSQFSAVPEPASCGMMLLGFAGLGVVGYRRSRKTGRTIAV